MERVAYAMTSGLLLAILVALFAPSPAVAIECGTNKSHNSFIGARGYNDQVLYIDHPKMEGHWLRVVSTDVKTGNLRGNISYIELLDQYTDGNGGCGYVTSGGPRSNNVTIHIKSQRGYGLDFIVRVWGRV